MFFSAMQRPSDIICISPMCPFIEVIMFATISDVILLPTLMPVSFRLPDILTKCSSRGLRTHHLLRYFACLHMELGVNTKVSTSFNAHLCGKFCFDDLVLA